MNPTDDEGSTASDPGYQEFLQFLQTPSPIKTTQSNEPPLLLADSSEQASGEETDDDSLPESLPDGPKVYIGNDNHDEEHSMEDSIAPSEDNEDEDTDSSSGSFYVGPGEYGFEISGSIHESDISETASSEGDEEVGSVEAGSVASVSSPLVDALVKSSPNSLKSNTSQAISDLIEILSKSSAPNSHGASRSITSEDDGYREFLQILLSPALDISSNSDGTVTMSIKLKEHEVGQVTLSVKDVKSVQSAPGYEDFLLFFSSPPPIKKANKSLVQYVPFSEGKMEGGGVDEKLVEADGEVGARSLGQAGTPQEKAEEDVNMVVDKVAAAAVMRGLATTNGTHDKAAVANNATPEQPTEEMNGSVAKKVLATGMIGGAITAMNGKGSDKNASKSAAPPQSQVETKENNNIKSMGGAIAAANLAYQSGIVTPPHTPNDTNLKSSTYSDSSVGSSDWSTSSDTSNSFDTAESGEEKDAAPSMLAAIGVAGSFARGVDVKGHDEDKDRELMAAVAVGASAAIASNEECGDDQVKNTTRSTVARKARSLCTGQIKVADETENVQVASNTKNTAAVASAKPTTPVPNEPKFSDKMTMTPIARIYFSDLAQQQQQQQQQQAERNSGKWLDAYMYFEEMGISSIYLSGVDLCEEDMVVGCTSSNLPEMTKSRDVQSRGEGNNERGIIQSTSEATFSDLPDNPSMQSLNSAKFMDHEPIIQEEQHLEPLAIGGNISVNKDFLASISSGSSFCEFFDCLSQASSSSEQTPVQVEFVNKFIRSASPLISMEDFYDCMSEISKKCPSESASEVSTESRQRSAEFVIKTFMLSMVFHSLNLNLEGGIAEFCIWGHLCARFMRTK